MGSTNGRTPLAVYLTLTIMVVLALRVSEISAQVTDSSNGSLPPGTSLADQTNNGSEPNIHDDDTVRVDPLDNFKKYRGGFDITNKHYWSSTAFTGIYGYAPGVLWLVSGILYGVFLLVSILWYKNRKNEKLKKKTPCHKQCYLWPILLAIVFTLLAIVASGVVLGGNARFYSEAKTVMDIIIDTADEASATINNTTGTMKNIRDNLGASGTANTNTAEILTSTSDELDNEAANINRQAKKNRNKIDKGLKIVFIITTVTISLNLVAVIALTVCGILRLQRVLRLLIALCWIFTVLCWLFFGIYFFVDNFASDTCTALESFQKNPYNNSLSSILPCDELRSAKSVINDVSAEIYNIVDEVNANKTLQQSGFSICNPFSEPPGYEYQPENCPSNSIKIGDIPKVLKVFICSDANNQTCENGGIFTISDSDYKTVEAYTTSVQSLLNVYPEMEGLVECQSVKDAFSEIILHHCKPVKKFIRMVWVSMVFISIIMVVLVLLWTVRSHHEKRHHFSDGSVKPQSAAANMMELGTSKALKENPNPSFV